MKILIVCSGNAGKPSSFVEEQAAWLKKLGVEIDLYLVEGKGLLGYLKNYKTLRLKISHCKPDLIHAHYGLSGFLSVIQFSRPTIITYHGSDLEINGVKFLSKISMFFAKHIILVNKKQIKKLPFFIKTYSIIPCGIQIDKFFYVKQNEARNYFGFNENEILILFSSRFTEQVKNYPLARKIIDTVNNSNSISKPLKLIEFKNYTREESNLLYNAVDLLLVTSHNETGPLVVKEALLAGCPVLSVDVGDVSVVMQLVERDWIAHSIEEFKVKMIHILNKRERFPNMILLKKYDNKLASEKIFQIYSAIL